MKTIVAVSVLCAVGLAACGKAKAPEWTRISAAGERVVYLDTANILVNAGVVYVTMQTRGDGVAPDAVGKPFGILHAEANCRAHLLEPSALKEEQYAADGKHTGMRLISISADETEAVLTRACAGR